MSIGIETREQFMEMNLNLLGKILGSFKTLYSEGDISLEQYIFHLKGSSDKIDVVPYFNELLANKKITRERCISELEEIRVSLERKVKEDAQKGMGHKYTHSI
ncbi:MAG: hypothetical protein AABY15_00715 [Nanoarchaeota archaeon]